jgi:ADP-ribose pyrophosphatase
MIADPPGWKTLSRETVYDSPHLSVSRQTVLTPSRPEHPTVWTVAERRPAVVIAPVTASGNYLLLRQERIPVRATMWEFPAGQIDGEDTSNPAVIEAAARRELREETGYELPADGSGEFIALGYFFSSQGFTDEHAYLFLAQGVVPGARGTEFEEDEGIVACQEVTPDELRRMVASNEITNANTLSAYAALCARGLMQKG